MPNKQRYTLELMAGFIGISQDSDSGVLQPEIGWWMQEGTAFDELLDKIQQEHLTLPPIDWSKFRSDTTSKEMIQLLDRFDGATLYPNSDRSWKIPRRCDARCYSVSEPEFEVASVEHLMDLVDGRAIACIYLWRTCESWIAIGQPVFNSKEQYYQHWQLEDITIIAREISEFFDRIFQAEGRYYFDELDFILSEL